MGANTRTYKFPLGAALLKHAAAGADAVPLRELATTYANYLVNRPGGYPQVSSSATLSDNDFLSVLGRERSESLADERPTELLIDAAERSIPGMVMQKFHNIRGTGEVAHRFYELEGVGRRRIVRFTPELLTVAHDDTSLNHELDARWRIVEASFDAEIGRSLIGDGVDVDLDSGSLIVPVRRISLTGVRGSIAGFQHGRCFYCHQPLDPDGSDIHVDHVFPFRCMNTGSWEGPNLNHVWNLVLACSSCNLKKSDRFPNPDEVQRLIARNDAIGGSPFPLRRALEITMGARGANARTTRHYFIRNVYSLVTEGVRV